MNRKTLVFGASLKQERYSNTVIHKLRNHNQNVVAFGMASGEILEVTIDNELVDYKNVDTITLYMNPKRQEAYYDYLIGLCPRRIIFNPGTENPEFYTLLTQKDISYEEACTLVLLSTNQY